VREPLTDVCQDEKSVVITVEMPGIDKDSIELETSDESMVIKVEKGNRKYYKDVKLPARVKPSTAKAKYNNGVLDITVEKEEQKKAGTKVKVE
jgi:HSP20 family protein